MLHISCMSLHNAELESTLLEGLPGEHTLVESSLLDPKVTKLNFEIAILFNLVKNLINMSLGTT